MVFGSENYVQIWRGGLKPHLFLDHTGGFSTEMFMFSF